MNAKQLVLAITIALPWSVVVQAQPLFFGEAITSDTIIDVGNPYPLGFGAYDDAGGGSPTVELLDGGYVGGSGMLFDESHFLMSGGSVGKAVVVQDDAVFTMTGGIVGEERPPMFDTPDIVGEGSGAIHLRGGKLASGAIQLIGETSLHVYGVGLELYVSDDGGAFSVTGMLQDGQPINAFGLLFGSGNSVFIHAVPEPSSISLAAAGGVTLLLRLRYPLSQPRLQRG